MQRIISFFINNKYFLLFLFLEFMALILTIQSHSYHRSKFINSSNFVTGFIFDNFTITNEYLNLRKHNNDLAEENAKLKNLLSEKNTIKNRTKTVLDSLVYQQQYTYVTAKVKRNQYTRSNNRLTLNKGKNDGVDVDFGVVNSKGIIGKTTNVSGNYATVMSIINENSNVNVRLLHSAHFGTLRWNGKHYNTVQFEDLPRQANIKVGDTIITGGKSTIFPEGILVGTIKDFTEKNNSYEIINVALFNDMSAIGHVNVILNLDKLEIKQLESE
jgi:rod shape-determining protein MreC